MPIHAMHPQHATAAPMHRGLESAGLCGCQRVRYLISCVSLLPCIQGTLKQKEAELKLVYPYSRSYGKSSIATVLSPADGGRSLVRVLPLETLLRSQDLALPEVHAAAIPLSSAAHAAF